MLAQPGAHLTLGHVNAMSAMPEKEIAKIVPHEQGRFFHLAGDRQLTTVSAPAYPNSIRAAFRLRPSCLSFAGTITTVVRAAVTCRFLVGECSETSC